jgi:hypothetical protein
VIAVVHSVSLCARGSVVVVVGAAVVVDAGTVVVAGTVVATIVVVVVVVVVAASMTHSSFVKDDVTTPRSKIGAIAMTDNL